MSRPKPIEVRALPAFRVWVRFDDGAEGTVDLSHLVGRGLFRAWEEPGFFERVHIAEASGTVSWPGELDLDPDVMYSKVGGKALPGQSGRAA